MFIYFFTRTRRDWCELNKIREGGIWILEFLEKIYRNLQAGNEIFYLFIYWL